MTRGIAPLILGYQAFDRGHPHRRRDPEPARRLAPRGEAARGDRALHRRAGARRRAARRAHDDRRAPPGPRARATRPRRRARASTRSRRSSPPRSTSTSVLAVARQAAPLPAAPRRRPAAAPAARRCASASRATPRSASTTRATSRPCATRARSWCAFDALHDERLPPVDGLFIGGGFPETHMDALAANAACAPSCARRSMPACRPTPSAAG